MIAAGITAIVPSVIRDRVAKSGRGERMKLAEKILLGVMGAVVPAVIAACYGPQYAYSVSGKVQDSSQKTPIAGVTVGCIVDGKETDRAVTTQDGAFSMYIPTPCDELLVTDHDGAENGDYGSQTIEIPANCGDNCDITIDLEAQE